MSFISGSECSTSRNPLAHFSKHASEDKSLQRERINPATGPATSIRSQQRPDKELMEDFRPHSFNMDSLRHEMANMQNAPVQSAQPMQQMHTPKWENPQLDSAGPAWSDQFQQQQPMQQQPMQQGRMGTPVEPAMSFRPQMSYMGGPMMGSTAFRPAGMTQQRPNQRVVELDDAKWEEQFQAIEAETREASAEAVDKGKEADTAAKELSDQGDETFHGDFESIWKGIQQQVADELEMERAAHEAAGDRPIWEKDFDQFTTGRPDYGEYLFEQDNKYNEMPDPFEEGVRLMESGGKLSEAALAFEAAVRQNPNRVEAWERLGACQAQNEKEEPAIRALERAVALDPKSQSALMNLSISYTNEGYENAAYATLERWLATKYPELVGEVRDSDPNMNTEDRFALHQRVTELFIRAAHLAPEGLQMDADVQVGLGVLFYGQEDYDKAIDCFNAALAVRPDDALIWNRLGATLANSHRSEEAIDAYHRALSLRPSFVRARYNLGVSCINIGCYREAAQHLLGALALHSTDNVTPGSGSSESETTGITNESSNLYETLRRVFMALGRRDLASTVGPSMNLNSYRQEFEF
ncbi:hypothetical protein CANCADRAFT_48878 [Tortispora caseinolytica NRRL Y-17796]|uniref:Peroxisomal targeting signal receptor n=1 Tax=Tortispora caseinolytica NRRL Y-17796 TaxID=767744 RepID=A0A1E4TLU4_9ASCO|nr:hypothetical protein CANCADRAFT_48878 [Tortispora caseinolytica NRRL Y-17796]